MNWKINNYKCDNNNNKNNNVRRPQDGTKYEFNDLGPLP